MDELTRARVEKLQSYAAWAQDHTPAGYTHVLDWAAGEIERLNEALATAQTTVGDLTEILRQMGSTRIQDARAAAYLDGKLNDDQVARLRRLIGY